VRVLSKIITIASVALTTACNSSEPITVSKTDSGNGPSTSPQGQVNVSPMSSNDQSSRGPGMVFFTQVFEDFRGNLDSIEGIGFAAPASTDKTEFVHTLDDSNVPFDSTVFVPVPGGVRYAAQSGVTGTTFSSFNAKTGLTSDLVTIPGTSAIQLSASSTGLFAWIDSAGAAWFMDSSDDSAPTPVGRDGLQGRQIQFIPSQAQGNPKELLLTGTLKNQPVAEIFSLQGASAATSQFQTAEAAASPDGTRIAYVTLSDNLPRLAIYDRNTRKTINLVLAGEISFHELSWLSDHELAYRTQIKSGPSSLRFYDLVQSKETLISQLHLPETDSFVDHLVCPVRDDAGVIYFADYQNSHFVILEAHPVAGAWSTTLFARATDDLTSLICPQIQRSAEEGK
jgi:hypothetical protein